MNSCRLAVLALFVIGCGASSVEIARAKAATYKGTPDEMFAIVEHMTALDYKIVDEHRVAPDDDTGQAGTELYSRELLTEPQWYEPEGGRESPGQDNFVVMADRSVLLSMIVKLEDSSNGTYAITITPKTFQHINGSPKPRELKPDDPNLPPWVTGRVESLYVKIHDALKKYEVK